MSNRTTLKFILLALVLCASARATAFAQAPDDARVLREGGAAVARNDDARTESAATREGRLKVFDEVWEQVRVRYFDPALRGVDWQEVRRSLRPRAADAGTEDELYAVLRRMLSTLRDPHTRVFEPGESDDWRVQHYISVGLSVREIEGEVVVTDVERRSEAARAGVRAGDAIVSVDGEPTSKLVARRLVEQNAGDSRPARLVAVTRLFDGPLDSTASIVFRRAGESKERSVRLRRETRTRVPTFEVRREGGGVRIVRFNIFTPAVAEAFARALGGELKGARSLVIDLRDNGGGEAEAMADLASTLLEPGASLGRFTDREGRVQLEPFTRASLVSSADTFKRFRGAVVLLTNARTASAAEVFAASLHETGRATVVGEATCGCVLGIRERHMLPDGGVLDISEMDYHTASGARLEGVGLRPDVDVVPAREDLSRGRDRALERAVEMLKLKERSASGPSAVSVVAGR
ncbi:MAG TPA: S41 family peptidase [Pyrinomonadaceae bacterium]|jgi:carboxyl-terminal processing protease|nr:S41 family peptidase [Pyrinomonadaceae bacterium]